MDLIPPSVVEGYDVSHLHALATHMTKSAADREELMGAVNGLAAGQEWVGAGREGQTIPLAEHNAQAMTTSAALAATAGIATAGAGSLYSQKQELVAGLNTAKVTQLQVDDEYNVTDPLAGTPIGTMRASAVQALQAQLKTGAQAFTATEHATAQAIHTAMQPTGNGHVSAVDYVTNPDGSVKYTPDHHAPALINEHGGKTPVAADPRDHNGTTHEIVEGLKKVVVGGVTAAGGGLSVAAGAAAEVPTLGTSTIPIVGGAGAIAAGSSDVYLGLDDLSHLTNWGQLPSAAPIEGQDGPG